MPFSRLVYKIVASIWSFLFLFPRRLVLGKRVAKGEAAMREAFGKDPTLPSEPETKSELLPLPMPGEPSDETTALAVSSSKPRDPDPCCHFPL